MHNIGFAKPYGYGKIDIKLTLKDLKYSQDEYLKEFEKQMNEFVPNWLNTKQLTELRSMASTSYKASRLLQYQQLENPKSDYLKNTGVEKNEFNGAKNYSESLNEYSKMIIYTKPQKKQNNQNNQSRWNYGKGRI